VVNMDDITINSLQHFFSADMQIKKLMYNICPPKDYLDESSMVKYVDDTYESLIYIFNELKCISKDILNNDSNILETITNMEKYIKDSFINAGTNLDKLNALYKNFISDMSVNYINDCKKEFFGYKLFRNVNEMLSKANTINEMLHCIHSYVINNDEIFSKILIVASKKNTNDYFISYRGNTSNNIFNSIYFNFPLDLDVGITDIISINENKLLLLIRDRGHALSIEVTLTGNIAKVDYFIPKICSIDKVNSLPGVNMVKDYNLGTTGMFEVDKDVLSQSLYDFISRVPNDKDLLDERFNDYNSLRR